MVSEVAMCASRKMFIKGWYGGCKRSELSISRSKKGVGIVRKNDLSEEVCWAKCYVGCKRGELSISRSKEAAGSGRRESLSDTEVRLAGWYFSCNIRELTISRSERAVLVVSEGRIYLTERFHGTVADRL